MLPYLRLKKKKNKNIITTYKDNNLFVFIVQQVLKTFIKILILQILLNFLTLKQFLALHYHF